MLHHRALLSGPGRYHDIGGRLFCRCSYSRNVTGVSSAANFRLDAKRLLKLRGPWMTTRVNPMTFSYLKADRELARFAKHTSGRVREAVHCHYAACGHTRIGVGNIISSTPTGPGSKDLAPAALSPLPKSQSLGGTTKETGLRPMASSRIASSSAQRSILPIKSTAPLGRRHFSACTMSTSHHRASQMLSHGRCRHALSQHIRLFHPSSISLAHSLYTVEEDETIYKMRKAGHIWPEIADVLGRTLPSVQNRSRNTDLREVLVREKVPVMRVKSLYSNDEDNLISRMRIEGGSWPKISNALPGRSVSSVKQRWQLLQMEKNRAAPRNLSIARVRQGAKRPSGEGWSVEEKELLLELRAKGMAGRELWSYFPNRSHMAIKQQYMVLRKARDIKLTPAKRIGLWSKYEDSQLRSMKAQGLTGQQISDALGTRSPMAVRMRWYEIRDRTTPPSTAIPSAEMSSKVPMSHRSSRAVPKSRRGFASYSRSTFRNPDTSTSSERGDTLESDLADQSSVSITRDLAPANDPTPLRNHKHPYSPEESREI